MYIDMNTDSYKTCSFFCHFKYTLFSIELNRNSGFGIKRGTEFQIFINFFGLKKLRINFSV